MAMVVGAFGLMTLLACDPTASDGPGVGSGLDSDSVDAPSAASVPEARFGGVVTPLGSWGFSEWRLIAESGVVDVEFFHMIEGARSPWNIGISGFGIDWRSGEVETGSVKLSSVRRLDLGELEGASAYFQGRTEALIGVEGVELVVPALIVDGNRIEPHAIKVTLTP